MPVCWADKDLDLNGVEVLDTVSPYVADKIQVVKHQIWNEALTYLGIENTNTDKKERMVSPEVMGNMGDVEAQRFTRLNSRKQFCKEVNEMFGLDIDVDFPKPACTSGRTRKVRYPSQEWRAGWLTREGTQGMVEAISGRRSRRH